MEITSELLETLYNRVEQVSIAKYNVNPDRIVLGCGDIRVEKDEYCCGSTDTEWYDISIKDLTSDLDVLISERKEIERLESEARAAKYQKEKEDREKREKQSRFNEYIKLKKEFDGE